MGWEKCEQDTAGNGVTIGSTVDIRMASTRSMTENFWVSQNGTYTKCNKLARLQGINNPDYQHHQPRKDYKRTSSHVLRSIDIERNLLASYLRRLDHICQRLLTTAET
jgi:hypothetical protein